MAIGGKTGGGGKASSKAIEAGEASVTVSADDSPLRATLARTVDRIKRMSAVVSKIGLGAAAAGASILGPILGTFREAAKRGDDLNDAAVKVNASTESLSRLGYAAELSNGSLEDIVAATGKLNKNIVEGAKGGNIQAAALERLGFSAEQFGSLDVDQRFLAIADTLDTMGSQLQKDQLLFALFGKSAANLKPLFADGAAGLRELLAEADDVGATLNSQDAKDAAKTMDAYDRSIKAVKFTVLEVGASLFGFSDDISTASKQFVMGLKAVREFIRENKTVIAIVAAVGAGLIVAGTALAVFGFAVTGIVAGVTALVAIFTTLYAVVLSPVTLGILGFVAAIVAANTIILALTGTLGQLLPTLRGVGATFQQTFGGILSSLMEGDFSKAGEIAMTGLQLAMEKGILFLTKIWIGFKENFVDLFRDIVYIVRLLFVSMGEQIGYVIQTIISGALRGLAKLAEQLGATDLLGFTVADVNTAENEKKNRIQAEADNLRDAITEDRRNADDENKAFRENQIREQQKRIDALQALLDELTKEKVMVPAEVKNNEMEAGDAIAEKIAGAVRGTFRSADYRGSLGIAGAEKEAKKQTKLLEGIEEGIDELILAQDAEQFQ